MQTWSLMSLDAPAGTRDPIVLHSDDGARAVLIVLSPGQSLGDHQVKENAWVTVLEGSVEITAGGESVQGEPGTMVRFEPTSATRCAARAAPACCCCSRRGPATATTAATRPSPPLR